MKKLIFLLLIMIFVMSAGVLAVESNLQASVRVLLAGDVNGDCKVDVFDLASVGLAYNTQPGDSNWNPSADLNKDNKVNLLDLASVGLNYNRIC